jgi:predicted choloylglycine hydrolase
MFKNTKRNAFKSLNQEKMHKSSMNCYWGAQVKEHQNKNLLNSKMNTMISQKQDISMNANTYTHKQLGVSSNLQKSWEGAPNCAVRKTCIEHALRTLDNSLWESITRASWKRVVIISQQWIWMGRKRIRLKVRSFTNNKWGNEREWGEGV